MFDIGDYIYIKKYHGDKLLADTKKYYIIVGLDKKIEKKIEITPALNRLLRKIPTSEVFGNRAAIKLGANQNIMVSRKRITIVCNVIIRWHFIYLIDTHR